jgi:hypothetical protein
LAVQRLLVNVFISTAERSPDMDRRTFLGGLVLAAAAPALIATEVQAANNWVYLGTRRAAPWADFDQINVGMSKGLFEKIRLKVTGNDLLVYDLKVRYANGNDDDIPVRFLIPQGGQTRVIDLNANKRFIRHVRFTYGRIPDGDGPTYVELYGRR